MDEVARASLPCPNEASVALHERLGLRRVATFREVGRKLGRWIDVGYWQTLLRPEPDAPTPRGGIAMQERLKVDSGTPWEPMVGYSRAVRVGAVVHV